MARNALPPLDDQKDIIEPSEAGKWTGEPISFLADLANSLSIARGTTHRVPLVSIPDIWAQTEQFEHALFVEKNPRAVAEWRGLFAVWALHNRIGYRLTFTSLYLDKMKQEEMKAGLARDHLPFAHAAAQLLPRSTLFKDLGWQELGIMRIGERSIALITPLTIFVPARNYASALDKKITWAKDGALLGPTKDLIGDELFGILDGAISQFVEDFDGVVSESRQSDVTMPDNIYLTEMLRLLRDFERDIADSLKGVVALPKGRLETATRGIDLPANRLYGLLSKTFDIIGQPKYDACAKPRLAFNQLIKGALVVSDALPSALSKEDKEIFIWGHRTLKQIVESDETLAQVRKEAAQRGYLTLKTEDFFTDDICRVQGQAISSHRKENDNENLTGYILPVKPTVLLFLDPRELRNKLEIRTLGDQVEVTLSLTVEPSEGKPYQVTLRRSYPEVKEIEQPFGPSVWPNFTAEWWKNYFVFVSATPGSHVVPAYPLSPKLLHRAIEAEAGKEARVQAAAWVGEAARRQAQPRQLAEMATPIPMLFKLEEAPEAMSCEIGPKDKTRDVGLLLMPDLAAPPQPQPGGGDVAIDFGTTNTSVYYKTESRTAQRLIFKNRCVQPFDRSSDPKLNSIEHVQYFLPFENAPLPFQTLLFTRHDDPIEQRFPIWTDFVLYNTDLGETLRFFIDAGRNRSLGTDLKWGPLRQEREKILLFIGQAALQAAAELAGDEGCRPEQIRWAFSYPEAYSRSALESFRNLCPISVSQSYDQSQVRDENVSPSVKFYTESECSALYFYSQPGVFASNTLTLDVGGGTTDVSLWQDRKMKWRTSLHFAGQNMLIDYLANSKLLLEIIDENSQFRDDVESVLGKKFPNKEIRRGAIEAIVNSSMFEEQFKLKKDLLGGQDSMINLRLISEFSLAAIFYYLALMTKRLAQEQIYNPSIGSCSICLGGRGSKVFEQLLSESSSEAMARLYNEISGHPVSTVGLYYSDAPKEEVAHGLLVGRDETEGGADESGVAETIIGESLTIGDSAVDALASYTDDLGAGEWRITSLLKFKEFVAQYQTRFKREVVFDEQLERQVINRVNRSLGKTSARVKEARERMQQQDIPLGHLIAAEPIFVSVLREVVRLMIDYERPIKELQ